jgi:NAD(P)-dependent dehydrogenase (short-subunit alcohol dehydrogenase family)
MLHWQGAPKTRSKLRRWSKVEKLVNDRDWLSLRDRVCVITGAASGIGRETAVQFATVGATVVAIDRDRNGCSQTTEEVRKLGGAALALECDVTDADSVSAAAGRALANFGRCDVLINNAGILQPGRLETLSLADWNALLQINLTGYFLCSQAFGRDMLARGSGVLVHIASIAAGQPQGMSGAYSASKAGVAMLSRQLAFEWGPRGIRSNTISPGLIRTPLSESFYQAPGVKERREAIVPLRAIGRPLDIANVVVFLASFRAGYITGQDIVVDGGLSQTLMSYVPRPGYD